MTRLPLVKRPYRRRSRHGAALLFALALTLVTAVLTWSAAGDQAVASIIQLRSAAATYHEHSVQEAESTARLGGHRVQVDRATTDTQTVYVNPNGSITRRIASAPVRVKAPASQKWAALDLTLHQISGGRVAPLRSPVSLAFAGSESVAGSPLVSVRLPNAEPLVLKAPFNLPAPELRGRTATYVDVLPDVDLRLSATSTGFEQSFIIKRRPPGGDAPRLTMMLASTTYQMRNIDRGAASGQYIQNKAGKTVGRFGAAVTWDSAGTKRAPIGNEVISRTRVRTSHGRHELLIEPNKMYLSRSSTKYPVTVDPQVWIGGATVSSTSYIRSDTPDDSYSNDTYLGLGTSDDGESVYRAFIQFDTSSIPSPSTINGATLSYRTESSSSCTPTPVTSFGIDGTQPAPSDITWSNQPSINPSLRYDGETAAGGGPDCPADYATLPALKQVEAAQAQDSGQLTLELRGDEEGTAGFKLIDPATDVNPPTLEVTYSSPLPADDPPQSEEQPVRLDLTNLDSFEDQANNPIDITSDTSTDDQTQRTVNGVESDGLTPVVITIYSEAKPSLDLNSLDDSESDPSPSPPDELTPSFAVASTPTTITTAWADAATATDFTLEVDGTQVGAGNNANYTVTGLAPEQVVNLTTTSSGSAPLQTAAVTPPEISGCTTTTAVEASDLNDWNFDGSGPSSTHILVPNGLEIYAGQEGQDARTTALRTVDLALADAKTPSLLWTGSGDAPDQILALDFDGNGATDGTLRQQAGSDEWRLDPDAAQEVTDAQPTDHTLPAWSTAFPSAAVKQLGFDLPGRVGAGIIAAQSLGCSAYTFQDTINDAPTPAPSTTRSLSVTTLALPTAPPPAQRGHSTRSLSGEPTSNVARRDSIHSTEFNYRTFIPYRTLLDSPNLIDRQISAGCAYFYYGTHAKPLPRGESITFRGDNRRFTQPPRDVYDPDLADYRTMMDLKYNWDNRQSIKLATAGKTHIVGFETGDIFDTQQASNLNMRFAGAVSTSDYYSVVLRHVANDPFCPSLGSIGSIDYLASIQMYRSGLVTVYGRRTTMPAHEGWVRWNSGGRWTNMFRLGASNLSCLVRGGVKFFDVNFVYRSKLPAGCVGQLHGSVARSADKWKALSTNGSYISNIVATTAGRRVLASGAAYGKLLAPWVEDEENCSTDDFVPASAGNSVTDDHLPVKQAVTGASSGTALLANGRIRTWGSDAHGWQNGTYASLHNLGRNPSDHGIARYVTDARSPYVQVAQSGTFTLALTKSGELYAWGSGFDEYNPTTYQTRTRFNFATPTRLGNNASEFTKVVFADYGRAALALDTQGHIWAIGNYDWATDGSSPFYRDWKRVDSSRVYSQLASVGPRALALVPSGVLYSWGSVGGQTVHQPSQVSTSVTFDSLDGVSTGGITTALSTDGDGYAFGYASGSDTWVEDGKVTLPAGISVATMAWGFLIDTDGELWRRSSTSGEWDSLGLPVVTPPRPVSLSCFDLS